MAYTMQMGNDFWFTFDDTFKDHPTSQVGKALAACFPGFDLDFYVKKWMASFKANALPQGFQTFVVQHATALQTLADLQDAIFVNCFHGDLAVEQAAFEDFGQGTLYDPRRAVGNRVHMMDIDGKGQEVGYQRWYCFAYALQLLNYKQGIWHSRLKFICLALAIHLQAKPMPDSSARLSGNPPFDPIALAQLRTKWLGANDTDRAQLMFDSSLFK